MENKEIESVNEIASNEKVKPFISTLIDSAVIIGLS